MSAAKKFPSATGIQVQSEPTVLLSDAKVQEFIRRGVLVVDTGLSAEENADIERKLGVLTRQVKNPGDRVCNNVVPIVPGLQQVIEAPELRGALTGILGRDYDLCGHRAIQSNAPRGAWVGGSYWHRDEYYADYRPGCVAMKVREHLPWSVICFYAPIDVLIEDIGPTQVYPGSQYLHEIPPDIKPPRGLGRLVKLLHSRWFSWLPLPILRKLSRIRPVRKEALLLRKGQVGIIHHDLWHAGVFNLTKGWRNLVKLEFNRVENPGNISWDHRDAEWKRVSMLNPLTDAVYASIWDALRGEYKPEPFGGDVADAQRKIEDARNAEGDRVSTAYALARSGGERELEALFVSLAGMPELSRRPSSAGILGKDADRRIPAAALCATRPKNLLKARESLCRLARDPNPTTRGFAVKIFASWYRHDDGFAGDLETFEPLLNDAEAWVRGQASVAWGRILRESGAIADRLSERLRDPDEHVRQYAAEALIGLPVSPAVVPDLERALDDENRYVKYAVLETLLRHGGEDSRAVALRHMKYRYYCDKSHWIPF